MARTNSGRQLFDTFSHSAFIRIRSLDSPQIFVNTQTNALLNTIRNIVLDSGTSAALFPTNTTEAIYALISPDILPHASEPGAYGIACDRIPTLAAVISIQFTAQDGSAFNLTIPSTELSVGPFADDPETCQTFINAFDGLNVLGGSLLKHYYSVWDVGGQRMGFAGVQVISGSDPFGTDALLSSS